MAVLHKIFPKSGLKNALGECAIGIHSATVYRLAAILAAAMMLTIPCWGWGKKDVAHYGAGLIVNVPLPEPEVVQVVREVSENTIIRGTKEYNKDEYVSGAQGAKSAVGFPAWTEGGQVFYKVRKEIVDPRNFKDSNDVGTLAVRYIVQPQGEKNTVLRIDAVFVEDFRAGVHASDGSVEGSEYKDIQDKLQAIQMLKHETEEALREKQEHQAKKDFGPGNSGVTPSTSWSTTASSREEKTLAPSEEKTKEPVPAINTAPTGPPDDSPSNEVTEPTAYDPSETLEQHVANLRHQVERVVKKPGAPLKSAPFHTASTLVPLAPGAEVLIVITSPYWYGVETRDGQHGWLMREELDPLP